MRTVPAWLGDRRLVAGLLFMATLLVYLPAMTGGRFHFDDMHSIVENPGVRSLANIPRFFTEPQLWSAEPGNTMYRPTLLVLCAIDYAVWGYKAAGWLLTNAMIHALVAVMVHRLALRIGLGDTAAFFAGAFFALHPALSEVQNYVSSRSESVAAAAMLAAIHLHISAREAEARRRLLLFAAAGAMSFVALLSKETAATFCAVIAVHEIVARSGPWRRRLTSAVACGAGYLVVAGVFLALRKHMLGVAVADLHLVSKGVAADVHVGGGRSVVVQMLTQCNAQIVYLAKCLVPVQLNIDYDIAIVESVGGAAVSVLALVAIVVAAVRGAMRGHRLFPLVVAWYACFSLVTFVIPLNVVMNEHRMYLPMIAVALLAGALLARVGAARGLLVAAVPIACFVPLVVQRSLEWRDDETLWRVAVERAPGSARARMHYGAVFHQKAYEEFDAAKRLRLIDAALAEYARSDELHPRWADLQLNIGNARLDRGRILHRRADFAAALAAFEKFGDIVGREAPRPRMLQAAAHAELGDVDRAIEMMRQVQSEDPESETRLYDDAIAHFLRRKGDKAGAKAAMERVIALDERDKRVDGLLDLGWWSFEDGDLDASERLLGRAFEFAKASRDFRPPLYIARFLVLQGQAPAAEKFLLDAKKLGWKAPECDVRWVAGGRTPGVFMGTVQPLR